MRRIKGTEHKVGKNTIVFETTGILSDDSIKVISDIMTKAKCNKIHITSMQRNAKNQARVMYNNLKKPNGVANQREIYKSAGQQVINVYVAEKAKKKSASQIKASMEAKINELGPRNVSAHAADPNDKQVVDISRNSSKISSRSRFLLQARAAKSAGKLDKVLDEPNNYAIHIEIPQKASDGTQQTGSDSIPEGKDKSYKKLKAIAWRANFKNKGKKVSDVVKDKKNLAYGINEKTLLDYEHEGVSNRKRIWQSLTTTCPYRAG